MAAAYLGILAVTSRTLVARRRGRGLDVLGASAERRAVNFLLAIAVLISTPPWLLMIFLPGSSLTKWLATSSAWVVALCLLYGLIFLPLAPLAWPTLGSPSLERLAEALAQPSVAVLTRIHLQAFALLVGFHVYREMSRRGISGWFSAPVLLLTMTAGPLGYLAFLVVGWVLRDRSGLEEHGGAE